MSKPFINDASKIFFPNLDGIRTFAFLLVFLEHSFVWWTRHFDFYSKFQYRFVHLLFNAGAIGVQIFFVLSGFLITYLIFHEIEVKKCLNIPFFYLRRFLRIWPLYFLLLTGVFLVYNNLSSVFHTKYLNCRPVYFFAFLSNFEVMHIHKSVTDFLPYRPVNITWSVSIEEQFYLIWPLMFAWIPRRLYFFIFFIFIAGALVFRYKYFGNSEMLSFHSLSAFGSLAIGGLSAYLSYYFSSFKSWLASLSKPTIVIVYFFSFLWIFATNEFNLGKVPLAFAFPILTSVLFSFIILEQNFAKNSFFKFEHFRFLTKWGKFTYGLYLLHMISIVLVHDIANQLIGAKNEGEFYRVALESLTSLIISFFVAYCSYYYYEQYFLKLKSKFTFVKTRT